MTYSKLKFLCIRWELKSIINRYALVLSLTVSSIFSITCCYAKNCSAISVGSSYGGGTVFCVANTTNTSQCVTKGTGYHGLIMANQDQIDVNSNSNNGVYWACTTSQTNATSFYDGAANTATIIAALPHDNSTCNAARVCHNYAGGGYTDWYLPSANELNNMYLYANASNLLANIFTENNCTGSKAGGIQCLLGGTYCVTTAYYCETYWSSTESSSNPEEAWAHVFHPNAAGYNPKVGAGSYAGVRAIRSFSEPPTLSSNLTISSYENSVIAFTPLNFTSTFNDCQGGATLTKIKITSLPSHGTLALSGNPVTTNEEIAVGNLGNLTYTPNTRYIGSDSFSWNGSDGTSYAKNATSVEITINDQPPTLTDVAKSIVENNVITFTEKDFSDSFNGYQGNPLVKIKTTSLPSHGALASANGAVTTNDEILLGGLYNLTYTPNTGYFGNDSFGWNGSDGTLYATSGAMVNIAIDKDQEPTLTNVTKSCYENDVMTFTATDFSNSFIGYRGNPLATVKITNLPTHGTLELSGETVIINQEISRNNLGSLTYTPITGYLGSDNFGWSGSDGTLYAINDANVNITINDQAPTLSNLSKSVIENEAMTFAVYDFSSHFRGYQGNSLATIQIVTLPTNGVLKLSNNSVASNQVISVADIINLTYIPNNNYIGSDSFSWNGSDGTLYAINAATVNITVESDQNPAVYNITKLGYKNSVITFAANDFTSSFSGYRSNPLDIVKITSLPTYGTLKLSEVAININDEIAVNNLGNLTYNPNTEYVGSDSFGWNGSDGTLYATNTASVNLTINNKTLALTSFDKSVKKNNTMSFEAADFANNFSGYQGSSLVNIKIITLPTNGTLQLSGISVTTNQIVAAADINNLTYTPNNDYVGQDSFSWNGSDGAIYADDTANVNININSFNVGAVVGGVVGGAAGAAIIGVGVTGGIYYYKHCVRPLARGNVELGGITSPR